MALEPKGSQGAAAQVAAIVAEAPEQERLESWIMGEVDRGVALPGLYPPNAETLARFGKSGS
ncbi:MAG: hypothetical protein IT521_00125 [Burkholderiales bacterium]|nr:hypothetical protein [Burkholderiales bacterium]